MTPPKKLAVGDRVAVYFCDEKAAYFGGSRQIGTVRYVNVNGVGLVKVELDGTASQDTEGHNAVLKFHPQQCRRLIRKQRRKIWIHENCIPTSPYSEKATISAGELVGEEFVCFIEVRKK